MLFVVSGPSGCGKSTLIGRVLRDLENLRFSVSHTTRPLRGGEVDGREYHFVSRDEFDAMVREGKFVEWAEVHGHRYGTSRAEIELRPSGEDVVLDIDVQGAGQIRAGSRKAVFVFVMPPVFDELRKRLLARKTDDPAAIEKRLETARREILAYGKFDYAVINQDLEKASAELKAIFLAERCRPAAREAEIAGILASFSGNGGRK
jgi:guanylate kinase